MAAAAVAVGEEAIIAQVHEFTEYFDREFGPHHPPFSIGTFEDAMEAARSTYKLLLIYLHDRNNMACDLFARCVRGRGRSLAAAAITPLTTPLAPNAPGRRGAAGTSCATRRSSTLCGATTSCGRGT